jgi:hypothetical protein
VGSHGLESAADLEHTVGSAWPFRDRPRLGLGRQRRGSLSPSDTVVTVADSGLASHCAVGRDARWRSIVAPGQTAQLAVTVRNWTDRKPELATDYVAGSIRVVRRNLASSWS